MSLIQRYRAYHLFLVDVAEDILATTLFFPTTLTLHAWNVVADLLIEFPHLEAEVSSTIWRIGRSILTLPLKSLTGLFSLTVIPFLALGLAALRKSPESVWKNYRFHLGRIFQELAASLVARIIFV